MDDKISVIVPVYNVASYIHQCVDSVIRQTYKNWELILVDDGSLDACPFICDEYVASDTRIKVIHKKNGGPSSARNVGISVSSGKWIMMIDGDDWIEIDTLEKCINTAHRFNADFIKCGLTLRYLASRKDKLFPIYEKKEDFLKDLIARRVSLSACAGLYKKSIFDNLVPIFPEGLNFGEDYCFIPRLLYYSEKFHIIDDVLYNYRIHGSGSVKSAKWSNAEQLIGCEEIVFNFFIEKNSGFYKESLFQGRADVKAYCYSLILKDYKKNKIHYKKIRSLYDKTTSLENASKDARLLFFIMHNSFTMTLFRFLWNLRNLLSDFLKAIPK